MAINDIVQTIAEARVDARSLSEFVFKPAGFKVARRLAPTVDTLQFYINRFDALDGDFKSSVTTAMFSLSNSVAEAEGKVAYIETTVQDAINNTAIEGGVLADTFVVVNGNETQAQVNSKTSRTYETVASMLSDAVLKSGQVAITNGYHAKQDGGGAIYTISSTPTDYSIPLANGLHAVFNDSFDIRKFGIRDSATLDQTDELTRMAAYADTRVYEIDFHNFSIMTPKKLHFKTGRLAELRGLMFSEVKHIKNAVFYNDKTEQLVSGTCPIHFMPFVNGTGEFRLTNVKFDVYVSDYRLISGEMDGFLCGMVVQSGRFTDGTTKTIETGYDLVFDGVEFLTPAVSYNLACAGIFTRNLTCNDLKGDYWGIYVVHHTKNLYANDVVGVFRDDLHTPSGRLLVTNLIHEEAEIAEGEITRNNIELTSCECYKKTTGLPHTVYKAHRIGSVTINKYQASNCVGEHAFYGGATTEIREKLYINSFLVEDCDIATVDLTAKMGDVTVRNANRLSSALLSFADIDTLTLENVDSFSGQAFAGSNGSCGELNIINSYVVGANNGIIRTSSVPIETINITRCELNTPKWIECTFTTLNVKNSILRPTTSTNNPIRNLSNDKSTINLVDTKLINNVGGGIFLLQAQTDVSLDNVDIRGMSNAFPSQVTVIKKQDVTGRFTTPVAERSIAPETPYTFTIPVKGYVVGSPVVVDFNAETELDFKAGIYTDNLLTVTIKNNTTEAITLQSGSVNVAVY